MLKQMKKTLGILLAVCFLMSVTAAAVSAGPVVVKEKKTAIIFLKDVKTKISKPHYHKHTNMSGRKGDVYKRQFTYWLSFLSIKGILRFEAKAIEFRETTKIARYIIK